MARDSTRWTESIVGSFNILNLSSQVREDPVAGLLLTTRLLLQLRGKVDLNLGGEESSKPGPSPRGDCPGDKTKSNRSNIEEGAVTPGTRVGSATHIAGLALDLLTIAHLKRGGLESRQVAGKPASTTDIYTWFFTNFCSWLATASPPQLRKVEESLLALLPGVKKCP